MQKAQKVKFTTAKKKHTKANIFIEFINGPAPKILVAILLVKNKCSCQPVH